MLIVAFWPKQRPRRLVERDGIDAPCQRPLEARHVQPTGAQAHIRARREIEKPAVPVEAHVEAVARAVGQLVALVLSNGIDEDSAQVTRQLFRVRDPRTVRGPNHLEPGRWVRVEIGVHPHRHSFIQIDVPVVQPFIGISDLPGVRRPRRRVVEAPRKPEVDLADFPGASLVADVECVLARFVGEVCDGPSVRGPRGISFDSIRRLGQVPDIALLCGHRQNLTTHAEHCAHTRWR